MACHLQSVINGQAKMCESFPLSAAMSIIRIDVQNPSVREEK
jgi:hypothetical protein